MGVGLAIAIRWHALMEGSIEDCKIRNIRCNSTCGLNSLDIGGVMQRCEWNKRTNFMDKIIIDPCRFMKTFTTVNNAVTDCIDLGDIDIVSFEVTSHHFKSLMVITNLFNQSMVNQTKRFCFIHTVFNGRTAGIDNEDTHTTLLCAWMAVIRIVLTISAISQPRLRSLTGFFSPCSIGPIAIAPAER